MFQYINKIENNREKKFFIEKVNLFVKLINVFAQKNNLIDSSINSGISENTITRLKELKIIVIFNQIFLTIFMLNPEKKRT